jgi:hypothetical protein
LGIYALLTAALTWPLASNLTIMDAGDSAFFAWEAAWELHALTTDPASLPHANIFHPLRFTLGMDEPVLGTTILALPLWPFTKDAVWLYNVLRLLTFALSGFSTYWLARELGCGEGPALFAGAVFAFSPIRTDQIAHLSTLGTQWLPALLLFMHRFARTGCARDALLAAIFFVLEFLACGYHGVIGLAILPLGAMVLLWGRLRERLPAAILATGLAGLALMPLYLMHHEALAPERYSRGSAETVFYSATVESFLATSSWNRVWGEATAPFRTIGPNNLFPGVVVLVLSITGAVVLWKRRQRPSRDALALLTIGLAATIVALGPEVRAFGRAFPSPFGLLREVVPVFQMIRVTSRAGVYLALPLAVLAAKGLGALRLPSLATFALTVAALAETVIAPIPMPEWTKIIDTRREPPAVYRWLADLPGRSPIVHLPMLDVYGLERRPRYHESIYMVYSTLHWKPLVNGYAGIEPAHYVKLRQLARGFPSREFLDALREIGVRYIVLHRGGFGPVQWPRIETNLPAFRDELVPAAAFGEDTVFELRAPTQTGTPQN